MKWLFGPTIGLFKRTFWRAYHRIRLGSEGFDNSFISANLILKDLRETTNGRLNHFYDIDGNQYRGWYKPSYGKTQHPLIKKYK